jgi:hypothetical protein
VRETFIDVYYFLIVFLIVGGLYSVTALRKLTILIVGGLYSFITESLNPRTKKSHSSWRKQSAKSSLQWLSFSKTSTSSLAPSAVHAWGYPTNCPLGLSPFGHHVASRGLCRRPLCTAGWSRRGRGRRGEFALSCQSPRARWQRNKQIMDVTATRECSPRDYR